MIGNTHDIILPVRVRKCIEMVKHARAICSSCNWQGASMCSSVLCTSHQPVGILNTYLCGVTSQEEVFPSL